MKGATSGVLVMARSDISSTVAHTCEISCFDMLTLLSPVLVRLLLGAYKMHIPGRCLHAGDKDRNSKTQITVDATSNAGNVRR